MPNKSNIHKQPRSLSSPSSLRPNSYLTGRTPFIACRADPRFSYCLYVPENPAGICVYVHGTYRDAALYRDNLISFAEKNRCLILAPLFPAGLIEPNDVDNYKHLVFHDIRFDVVLLHMINEVSSRYAVSGERFLLGGFSGGAQFAQRFFYLHPQRLQGVSLAAPGRVTLLDTAHDWWAGIRNIEALFGQTIDTQALQHVPVQLVIGADDSHDITISPESPYWTEAANVAGTSRLERVQTLYEHYQQQGIEVRLDILDGIGHEGLPLLAKSTEFFERLRQDLL